MVSQEADLNQFLKKLASARRQIENCGANEEIDLHFTRREVVQVADAFARSIRVGEARLHHLCELFCDTLFESERQLTSVVVGELPDSRERFTLTQPLDRTTLYSETDLALGNRMLEKILVRRDSGWVAPVLVANVVEYQPAATNSHHLHKIISRIKAEEEIWNKVADEIFDLDAIVARDKVLRENSRFVKDVFGIKMVVSDPEHSIALHQFLEGVQFTDEQLSRAEIPAEANTRALQFLETKDYLVGYEKGSGWRAVKSVLGWWDSTFEIQIQPLENYTAEREHLTRESHAGFKSRREQIRDHVAAEFPLFGFLRALLFWLFRTPSAAPPVHPNVRLMLEG